MLIESIPKNAPWSMVSRSVFWSRQVALETWRDAVIAGHRAYLPDSVSRMSSWNFIRFLGRSKFVKNWPTMRQSLAKTQPGLARLDAAWSWAATGTFNMPPQASLARLPGRGQEAYDSIVNNQGASIYEVAKKANLPYRRAHAHVNAMIDRGLVRSHLDDSGPRVKRRLFTIQ